MSKLGDALERAEVPMRAEPVERTEALARATVAPEPPRRRRRTLAAALAAVLAVSVLAASPPGRSAISWAADVVGIGGEPSKGLSLGPSSRQAVIASGSTPNGTPWEVVASTEVFELGGSTSRVLCFRVDLLGVDAIRTLTCATDALARAVDARHVFPRASLSHELGENGLIVEGPASTAVASAEVVHLSEGGKATTYPAEVIRLEPPVSDQIAAPRAFNFVVAFLPGSLVPPRTPDTPTIPSPGEAPPSPSPGESAEGGSDAPPPIPLGHDPESPVQQALGRLDVVAYDADGAEIGRERLSGPNAELMLYPPLPAE